jgi:sialidase-1
VALRLKPNAQAYEAADGWQDAFVPDPMHMKDYVDEEGYRQQSASFIDAVIVQDTLGDGRIFLLADAWAWNGGLFKHLSDETGPTQMRKVSKGDGFCTIEGKKYLLLSDQNIKGDANGKTANINDNTAPTAEFLWA